jgi:hypothetical protein
MARSAVCADNFLVASRIVKPMNSFVRRARRPDEIRRATNTTRDEHELEVLAPAEESSFSAAKSVLGGNLSMEHPIDEAIRKHPNIFTESARKFEGEAFEEALSRWAREFPEEAAAYEDSLGKGETMPMEILDYWDDIEEMAKRYPELSIVEVARKWIAENPGVIPG